MASSRYQNKIQNTGPAMQAAEVTSLWKHLKPGLRLTNNVTVFSLHVLHITPCIFQPVFELIQYRNMFFCLVFYKQCGLEFYYQYSRVPLFLVCDLVFDFLPQCSCSVTTHCPHSSNKLILLHVVAGVWVNIKRKGVKNIANNTLYFCFHLLYLHLWHFVTLSWNLILNFTQHDSMQF